MTPEMELLVDDLARFAYDPHGFAMYAFPWGEPGELENYEGLEDWQDKYLRNLSKALQSKVISQEEAISMVFRMATTSGHGVGKSALVAILILWAMSTCVDCIGVVTANTENQLKTKTWVQVAKWYRLFIGNVLFKYTATALFSRDPDYEKTWRFDMVPWSEKNTEAFAGLHNQGKRILLIMDEASAIPDVIWEVSEGALTDKNTEIIWAVFGNPTDTGKRFRDCFPGGKFTHRWKCYKVDSRSVRISNKELIEEWRQDYGEDSDFFRVRVLGEFPKVDASSFISLYAARQAAERDVVPSSDPIVLGVDVARFGKDVSVIYPRQGRDARSRPPVVLFGVDTMQLANEAARIADELGAVAIFVDGTGVGGGVVDRLRQLQYPVIEVGFGKAPSMNTVYSRNVKYKNKRTEIWGEMRSWLNEGAIVDAVAGSEKDLTEELSGPQYALNDKGEIVLERKEDMERRGVPSPNIADALACTFAEPTASLAADLYASQGAGKPYVEPAYNPYQGAA